MNIFRRIIIQKSSLFNMKKHYKFLNVEDIFNILTTQYTRIHFQFFLIIYLILFVVLITKYNNLLYCYTICVIIISIVCVCCFQKKKKNTFMRKNSYFTHA